MRKKKHGGKRKGAGRPSKPPTKTMRVPESLVDTIVDTINLTDPQEAANRYINDGITHIEYKELQWERAKRLLFFKKGGIDVLTQHAQQLYDWGEKVYSIIKEHDESTGKSFD